jgi:thiol:disulfide interchange protein DsbD
VKRALLLGAALAAAPGVGAQEMVSRPHVVISLVPARFAMSPGQPLRLAIRFQAEPGWHIYWRNPGQAGIATTIQWTMPSGFTTDSLAWPVPERFEVAGIVTHVLHGESVLTTALLPPLVAAASPARIGAEIRYGICKEVCLPGEARLALSLPWASGEQGAESREWRAVQQAAGARRPRAGGPLVEARVAGTELALTVRARPGQPLPDTLTFFASDRDLVPGAISAAVPRGATSITLRAPLRETPRRVRGVLAGGSRAGWAVEVKVGSKE